MTSKEKIRDIKSVINEFYHNEKCEGRLTECARKSWLLFQEYCDDILQALERLELEVHCKNNSIKILEAFHKSQIENYLQKENKLLDELIICKQQIKILKKALPYYNIKVLCNAGRITEEELEILLKYEVINDDK